ncbi:MAG TPA: ABC transporter permease [Candidatus Acidoferrum sp.]|nr:ABC transporter permease [Candidatus Acidoferrum sp.]
MNYLTQIFAITMMSLSTIKERLGSTLVIVAGTAGVVAVLVSMLALSNGVRQTISSVGRDERAVVVNKGATSAAGSNIPRDAVLTVLDKPGIMRGTDGKLLATSDAIASLWLPHINEPTPGSVTLRGVTPDGIAVRPEITLTAGRMFTPGLRQVIVGEAVTRSYAHLDVGDKIVANGIEWEVVGNFKSGGNLHESEIWSDAESVLAAFHRNSFNTVTVWVGNEAGFNTLKQALDADPTLTVDLHTEKEFYNSQSSGFSTFLAIVGKAVGGIMAVGAIFGSINAMYTAVSARTGEIATLRAIGFGASGVVVSVFVEAMLLALAGALVGSALAWLLFNGNSISTVAGNSGLAQVVFDLHVNLAVVLQGIEWALILGLIGGLLPAIRAARLPVVVALRGA